MIPFCQSFAKILWRLSSKGQKSDLQPSTCQPRKTPQIAAWFLCSQKRVDTAGRGPWPSMSAAIQYYRQPHHQSHLEVTLGEHLCKTCWLRRTYRVVRFWILVPDNINICTFSDRWPWSCSPPPVGWWPSGFARNKEFRRRFGKKVVEGASIGICRWQLTVFWT